MDGSNGVYRFTLGAMTCYVLDEGYRNDQPLFDFLNASDEDLQAVTRAYTAATGDPADRVSDNILLIDTGALQVLVDTGRGPIDATHGKLPQRLAAAGFAADDINLVIVTHAHFDHIAMNADAAGQRIFPNARYVISQTEWDAYTGEPSDDVRANLLSIADHVERIAPDAEIAPGIRAMPAPGHSPGQIALLIESNGERLLHTADAWHHPAEIEHPEWYLVFDSDPDQAVQTRRELLAFAAREGLRVLPYHFRFPGLGRVVARNGGYAWQPEVVLGQLVE